MIIPAHTRILSNYPFTALTDLGWRLDTLSPPKVRIPGKDPIRTAHFSWGHSYLTFDVTESGEMSEFATYARGDDPILRAETAQAVVLLCAANPKASFEELLDTTGVSAPDVEWE
ncbi:hypothetical protein [Rhodococcus sp. NPDC060176]|uniref:hypothetical protein n=1 Tax=Rhodococcus sp. NPDC060176 TaxID=3347062 RepID=UPI0036470B58